MTGDQSTADGSGEGVRPARTSFSRWVPSRTADVVVLSLTPFSPPWVTVIAAVPTRTAATASTASTWTTRSTWSASTERAGSSDC